MKSVQQVIEPIYAKVRDKLIQDSRSPVRFTFSDTKRDVRFTAEPTTNPKRYLKEAGAVYNLERAFRDCGFRHPGDWDTLVNCLTDEQAAEIAQLVTNTYGGKS